MTQAVKHPLKWRLADMDGTGTDQVNVVMPEMDAQSTHEILLATDIPSPHSSKMDISWTDEDLDLFHALVEKVLSGHDDPEQLDLANPEIVDILHMVAAAHFIEPVDADLVLADDVPTVLCEADLGELVAIHTQDGYKSCIIAELDSIEAVCVLLEPLILEDKNIDLEVYDTLVVNKHSLLPAEFGNVEPDTGTVVH
ncbi:hypothetical protein QNI23_002070 [Bermanella sp. WJH001]|uniref:hypothetical protein n=1 Tax=Bermanella sp. WJH001 TaxID=3048005 RepID=UPI0024BE81B6|nr:hypothetical protein [Bermanella sp. WJH001]MDJ1538457.1 hypothetical protein [Bermanella sp. WJH001]